MQVRDIMTDRVAWCTPDTTLNKVARLMEEHDCGSIPVVRSESDQHLEGIITDRDIVLRAVAKDKNPLEMTAADCMSKSVKTVNPEADLHECCQVMERNRVRRVAVVNNGGECCGIVSLADIALHASEHETAEVVHDVSEPSGRPRAGVM